MKVSSDVAQQIIQHAQACLPNECCGLLVQVQGEQCYLPCQNIAAEPTQHFEISPEDYLRAQSLGQLLAVVHSHPDGEPYLSGADRVAQVASGVAWILVVGQTLRVFRYTPHLRGRGFVYGQFDCGAIVRDAYMLAGIELEDCIRCDLDADADRQITQQHLIYLGFEQVSPDEMQAGDVWLTASQDTPDHMALYLGDGRIVHHVLDRLSRVEDGERVWRHSGHSVWRYPRWQKDCLNAILNDLEYINT